MPTELAPFLYSDKSDKCSESYICL